MSLLITGSESLMENDDKEGDNDVAKEENDWLVSWLVGIYHWCGLVYWLTGCIKSFGRTDVNL
jgi:hypothetical protein